MPWRFLWSIQPQAEFGRVIRQSRTNVVVQALRWNVATGINHSQQPSVLLYDSRTSTTQTPNTTEVSIYSRSRSTRPSCRRSVGKVVHNNSRPTALAVVGYQNLYTHSLRHRRTESTVRITDYGRCALVVIQLTEACHNLLLSLQYFLCKILMTYSFLLSIVNVFKVCYLLLDY